METVRVIPSGVIALMRQLNKTRCLPLTALAGEPGHNLRCLKVMRDVYGAVVETRAGWRLTYAPQWLAPLSLPLPFTIADDIASTQQAIRRYTPPHALLAEHQHAGIGRYGRGWLSLPADAITLSLCLDKPPQLAGLSVALGVMLCSALSDRQQLRFKWPNDIVTPRCHKVAGILTQVTGDRLIIGIGVNWRLTATLTRQIAALGRQPAALSEQQEMIKRRRRCVQIIVQTMMETAASYSSGFAPFRSQAAQTHIAAVGQTLVLSNGRQLQFAGFDTDGALLAGSGQGIKRYMAEEVSDVAGG